MYLRTVPRVSPVRRAIADTLKPCSCSSRITINSLNRTTPDLPRTVRGKVVTCRALHRDPASNGQPPPSHRAEVVKIQPPDLERIHPAMTHRLIFIIVASRSQPDGRADFRCLYPCSPPQRISDGGGSDAARHGAERASS